MKIVLLDSKLWATAEANGLDRKKLELRLREAAKLAKRNINEFPKFVNIVVSPTKSEWVIPETGDMGMTYSDEYISITFDPSLPYGTEKLYQALFSTTLHELAHAAFFAHEEWRSDVMYGAVTEGLASVFERNFSQIGPPLWAHYEGDGTMVKWYDELKNIKETGEKNQEYFIEHSDGRKWIVYKTGTWMIDKLMKSGMDFNSLLKMNSNEIIKEFESIK